MVRVDFTARAQRRADVPGLILVTGAIGIDPQAVIAEIARSAKSSGRRRPPKRAKGRNSINSGT